jgi:predicted lipoprotein with Yx(FWY)xxD motif
MTPDSPPQTPVDISLFVENGKYVFRVGDAQSIYVFDRDKAGVPTCAGECAREWQPVIASKGASPLGPWTLVARTDGSKQWRYRNRPVYTFARDKPGQTSGDGAGGVWHVVKP